MVSLMIEQFKTELRWLGKVARELPRRAKAKKRGICDFAGTNDTALARGNHLRCSGLGPDSVAIAIVEL